MLGLYRRAIYNECIESCKRRIECGNTWPDGSRGEIGLMMEDVDIIEDIERFRDDCPIAYRKDGKYSLYTKK